VTAALFDDTISAGSQDDTVDERHSTQIVGSRLLNATSTETRVVLVVLFLIQARHEGNP
jgi:hypothetical protein